MRSGKRIPCSAMALGVLLASLSAAAGGPYPMDRVPPDLEEWVDWVLFDDAERSCPLASGEHVCRWPGALALDLEAKGGRFAEQVFVDAPSLVVLPGDTAHWPVDVAVDGKTAAVLEDTEGRPAVDLGPGAHRLSGVFTWSSLPEGIRVPPDAALVSLTVDGAPIPFPRRDEGGLLWLQSAALGAEEDERLDLTVMRHLGDGVPLVVTTRIVARASGKSREVSLGNALVPGTTVLSVSSQIPARVDQNGNLKLQVRAGTHEVTIVARTEGMVSSVLSPTAPPPWPAEETWVWQADEKLRQVTLSGPPAVDPSRTNLPEEWRTLPAYLVSPGARLSIATTRRGEPDPPPDQITLARELWMDLDGNGFTARDTLRGSLNRTTRLDLPPPGLLGRAAVDGVDQLVTVSPATKHPGVELRRGELDLVADFRLESPSRDLPAVGWSEDVQQLFATLHLPPGWTLVTAAGVDELPGTWWDAWDLFDFFFVLIVSLAVGRLIRWQVGAATLLTLVLCHERPDAPYEVWVSLLAALALLKVVPPGRIKLAAAVWWWASVAWLVIVVVPFSVNEARTGLFPQVEREMAGFGFETMAMNEVALPTQAAPAKEAPPPPAELEGKRKGDETIVEEQRMMQNADAAVVAQAGEMAAQRALDSSGGYGAGALYRSAGKMSRGLVGVANQSLQQDPKAVVQTGPGVPGWRWNEWRLSWSGPVGKDHRISLYLLSPRVNLVLSILRVLLLVLIGTYLVLEARKALRRPPAASPPAPPADSPAPAVTTAVTAGLAVAILAFSGPARAGATPDPALLDQLRERLLRPVACDPDCLSTTRLDIRVAADRLTLTAEVHAGRRTFWVAPGPMRNFAPVAILVDGRPTTALASSPEGFLRVRLEPGRHRVEIGGPMPPSGALTLELAEAPHHAAAEAPGWSVEGVTEDGKAESSIQITRKAAADGTGAADDSFEEGSYPPWLEITRFLDLGIPWLVRTTARRVSPPGSPIVARVPLLPGESVTESDLQVEGGAVVLSLGRADTEVTWSSTLAEQPSLELTAAEGKPWSEVWVIGLSPIWECAFTGIAPTERKSADGYRPTFRPWPGERLGLAMTRPVGMAGQSTTVDSARLEVAPGIRLVKADLTLSVRSSRGGVQRLTLPRGAAVQTLTVDGAEQPFHQSDRAIAITLRTGQQTIAVSWQQQGGITSLYRTPEVSLGGRAVNVGVTVNLPSDRWLLLTGGPAWGPAVLFWGFLLTILLAGLLLGRVPLAPLKSWQWMLLALGLTQVPVPVSLVVVGWFFALALRGRRPIQHAVWHDLVQILLAVWTAVAVACLGGAIYDGLAVQPDMQVRGGGSSNTQLVWYVDRIEGVLPSGWVLSVPILVWKLIMLAWALWLAGSVVKWAPWAFRCFSAEAIWRKRPPRPKKDAAKG